MKLKSFLTGYVLAFIALFFILPSPAFAQGVDLQGEIPAIVKECAKADEVAMQSFTDRYNDLSKEKKELLNLLVARTYGDKNLKYNIVHLDIQFKAVEYFTAEQTEEYLKRLRELPKQ